jgi:hypothetical protein
LRLSFSSLRFAGHRDTQKVDRDADDSLKLISPLMAQLVQALFVLGREREVTLELMERIRPELRLIIKRSISMVKQEACVLLCLSVWKASAPSHVSLVQ